MIESVDRRDRCGAVGGGLDHVIENLRKHVSFGVGGGKVGVSLYINKIIEADIRSPDLVEKAKEKLMAEILAEIWGPMKGERPKP